MKTHPPTSLSRLIRSLDLRNARITRFAPILLSVLVGAVSFTAMRGAQISSQVGGPERDRRELTARIQASLGEAGPLRAPRIHGGDRMPETLPAGAAAEPARFDRRLERGGERFELEVDRRHFAALRHLLVAIGGDATGAEFAEAERQLGAAIAIEPTQAALWNDLGVVYLSWAVQLKRPRLYLDAYAATQAARLFEADLPEARINQALALERLGLFQEAAKSLEGSWPGWANPESIEDRRHELEATDPVSLEDRFVAALTKAADEADRRSFLEIAEMAPPAAVRFTEYVLLPRWAASQGPGDGERAQVWLEMARSLGQRLAEPLEPTTPGDSMLKETVAAIDRAADDSQRLASLHRGHRAFGRGIAVFPERPDEARRHFEEAERALDVGNTPFADWARFYVGACRHIQRDLSGAMTLFDLLRGSGERFPGLEVRRGWGRSLIFNQLDQASSAIEAYRPAHALAATIGDQESVAAIAYQEAEASAVIGNEEDAWRALAAGLQVGDFPMRARFRVNILFTAVDRVLARTDLPPALRPTLELGFTNLQELFRRHAVEDAERSGIAMFVAQARNRSAVYLEMRGRLEEAEYQRSRAREVVASVPDLDFRRRLEAEIVLGAASTGAVEYTEEVLREALETFRQENLPFRVVETTLALADQARRQGKPENRERWLTEAQRVVEVLAADFEPVRDRYRYLAATQQAFRARIVAALEGSPDATRALELYLREQELQRRALTNVPTGFTGRLGGDSQTSRLPPGNTFVAWLALPDGRLVVLVLGDTGVESRVLTLNAGQLAKQVIKLRSLLEANGSPHERSEADSLLEELSRQLIEPILGLLPPAGGTLGMSMDDVFVGIPFEALFAGSGKRLAERFTITRVSSPDLLLRSPLELSQPQNGALAIGADKPAESWNLKELDGVRNEIARIQKVFRLPAGQVLSGADSRRSQIMGQLSDARWLHFAGHALADPYDPTSSLLILAEDGDGSTSLSIEDLAKAARGQLELAILAGCDTARSGTGGLAQALERGGVPVVIGSQWPVNDEATAKFFNQFYQFLAAGVPPVQALHQTQLAALRSKDPQLASVATWAAFTVWGW